MHDLLMTDHYKNSNGIGTEGNFVTYVELNSFTNLNTLKQKASDFIGRFQGEELRKSNSKVMLAFQPIKDIHLSPGLDLELSPTMSVNTIYFFGLISVFILIIAWVNYINLATARATERAREVGIKKALGVQRNQLISQFLFESVLLNFVSVAFAIAVAYMLTPILGQIIGKNIFLDFADPTLWILVTTIFLLGSFVSGAYPSFVLSSLKTLTTLKGGVDKMNKGFSLRSALVVFQFTSSIILISGAFAIYRQVFFMQKENKGFDSNQILIVNGPGQRENNDTYLESLKTELKRNSFIQNVATSEAIPGGGYNWGTGMRKVGVSKEESQGGGVIWVDPDFIDVYKLNIVSGKIWDYDIASDMQAVLINEAAVKAFGFSIPEKAVGEKIIASDDTLKILGVLKNYHWNSLKSAHTPFVLAAKRISHKSFSIKLSGKNHPQSIEAIEKQYKAIFPNSPFEYYFLDDFYNNQYKDEQQFQKIFSAFAVLAITIACLGLWGLALFVTNQKLKEISIRKIHGASPKRIFYFLSFHFLKPILIASAFAIPFTWIGIDRWLERFAFRIEMTTDLFILPILLLSVIAFGTIGIHVLRASIINPVKLLRSE
jgi:putative ABC transport system permease protein